MSNFRGGRPVTADAVSLVLATIDRIKALLDALERHQAEPQGNDGDLIARLQDMAPKDMSAKDLSARDISTKDSAADLPAARVPAPSQAAAQSALSDGVAVSACAGSVRNAGSTDAPRAASGAQREFAAGPSAPAAVASDLTGAEEDRADGKI